MNLDYTLKPVAGRLAELLGRAVEFADDCVGPSAQAAVDRAAQAGKVVLLENLRFHPEEEKNDAGVRGAAGRAGRRVRQRRVRVEPPGARVGRGDHPAPAARRPPAC